MTTSSATICSQAHRIAFDCFSGNGEIDDCDSSSRELARAVEEIDGRAAIRMIFRVDRYGRGGDHYPFYKAGSPAVRFTEPLEDYNHEHQTPRTENGVEYGDYAKYLNAALLGNVARDNAEALRQLALAPAPPTDVHLAGAVTPGRQKFRGQATTTHARRIRNPLARNHRSPLERSHLRRIAPGETILKGNLHRQSLLRRPRGRQKRRPLHRHPQPGPSVAARTEKK